MALVESVSIPIGTKMPTFSLLDCWDQPHTLETVMGIKGLIVAFTCNHCPYAVAIWPRLTALAKEAAGLGISTIAINPNIHPDYPEDSPQYMKMNCKNNGIDFPYLVDDTQSVARAYNAQCTPDLYLLDHDATLVYHGRLDDNWKDPSAVAEQSLRNAVRALSAGQEISDQQFFSMGCSIKWK